MSLDPTSQVKINSHYQQLLQSLAVRQFSETVEHMKAIYEMSPSHPISILGLVNQMHREGLYKRDYVQIINLYTRHHPDDPAGHLLHAEFCRSYGTLEQFRKAWQKTEENAHQGFHLQPPIQATVFDAENGAKFTAVGTLGLGARLNTSIGARLNTSIRLCSDVTSSPDSGAGCETLPAEPIDSRTVALNGVLHGFTEPGAYFFRYGQDPNDLSRQTPERFIPGTLNGRVLGAGDNIYRDITSYSAQITFASADNAPTPHLSWPLTKMILAWPFGKDRNHKNGIGVIDLLLGWKSAAHNRPVHTSEDKKPKYPSADYPGEALDLTDAVFSVTYRAPNFDPRNFRPVVWIHGRTGTALLPNDHDDLAAWAVTGDNDPVQFINDGEWHQLEFQMPAHSDAWSYCGSNTEEMGDGMARYCYAPIQELQRRNTSGNICICFVGGDDLDTPVGDIEIAALELRYRSRSLLASGQGAQLVSTPEGTVNDPEMLTDGTIRVPEHWWHAHIQAHQPCVLKWSLRERIPIECIMLHQNPLAPSKEVAIDLSDDDDSYVRVWSGQLDNVSANPADWADAVANGEGSGLCRLVVPETPVSGRFIRVTISSGHRGDTAGLDAVEAFSDALAPIPDDGRVTCSELAVDLSEGEAVYARLVVESGDRVYEGDMVQIERPAPNAPQILKAHVLEQKDDKITLRVRTRAGSLFATLHTTLITEDGNAVAEVSVDVGKWDAPRDTIINFALTAPPTYPLDIVCRIENASAEDEIMLPLQQMD